MNPNQEEVARTFAHDVKDHTMTVLQDDGIRRHLRFSRQGSSCYQFDIITWNGYLCYTGDMGCYVFSRLSDMFEFFRHDEPNMQYWAEKVQASDKNGGVTRFEEDTFRKRVREWADEYVTEEIEDAATRLEFLHSVQDDILYACTGESEETCYTLLHDFQWQSHYPLQDYWEWDFSEYTHRYVWCCYALVWAIKQYDAYKDSEINV